MLVLFLQRHLQMLDEVLALNGRAFKDMNVEAAYHLLAAALHLAEVDRNLAAIENIIALAEHQGDAIDQLRHRLGETAAAKRGSTPLYRSLITTAHSMKAIIRAHNSIADDAND